MSETISEKTIRTMLRDARASHSRIAQRSRVRRNLVVRANNEDEDLMGTFVPSPFDESRLILKTVIGETAKAAQNYAARLSANTPKVSVAPTTTRAEISKTVDKTAGEQERMDMQMWEECGGRAAQWELGFNQSIDAVAYILTLPRDADFGLPDREYYDTESDEEIQALKKEGKITSFKVPDRKGKLVYAEPGDVWATRRKTEALYRATSGRSLFTIQTFTRDMVYVWRDRDGIKAAAIVEEIPSTDCDPGSEIATHMAKKKGISEEEAHDYGIWVDREGHIVGGIEKGAPPDSSWTRPQTFTLIRFFTRIEQIVMISKTGGTLDSAEEIYRGKHKAKKQGVPFCPVIEVPMMRTGVNVPGFEFTTPMEPVFAYAPLINQMLTILSNASTFNGIPRWVIETKDGSTLRGEDGEPKTLAADEFVPGLSPDEATAVDGTLRQVLIDTKSMHDTIKLYIERMQDSMPAPVFSGESGASAAAWQVRQLIQQGQEALRQGVDNQAAMVKDILQLWHGWMRDLDVPIYFFPAPGQRAHARGQRNLIEFDPKNLTDSFTVKQDLDTAADMTVLLQQGIELHQAGYIDDEEFYEDYARAQDTREAVKRRYKQQLKQYWWTGALPPVPPGAQMSEIPMVKVLGDALRGRVFYELIKRVPQVADQVASDQAAAANAQSIAAAQMPQGGDVASVSGVAEPGMNLASSLEQTLGTAVPGGRSPVGGVRV